MAKAGQMDAVKIMAKDLVRTRRYVKKFMLMRANIQAVSLKIQTLKSQNAMAQAMKGVTKAMMNMNKQMKLPEIQKIMQEFEKQSEIMDMKEEMMNDVMDDAMGDEDDEEETDAIVTHCIVHYIIHHLLLHVHDLGLLLKLLHDLLDLGQLHLLVHHHHRLCHTFHGLGHGVL